MLNQQSIRFSILFVNLQISRVQNEMRYLLYKIYKSTVSKELKLAGVPVERALWHGTTANCVESICRDKFDRIYAGKNGRSFIWCLST